MFGVILGTGTGGGIAIDGHVVTGANAIAGEWGHNPLPWLRDGEWPGPPCYCGRSGCIETFLSGPALARDYRRDAARSTPARIVERADGWRRRRGARASTRLRGSPRTRARERDQRLDPDVIVLGGGLSNIERLYDAVPRRWGDYVFSDSVVDAAAPRAAWRFERRARRGMVVGKRPVSFSCQLSVQRGFSSANWQPSCRTFDSPDAFASEAESL